MKITTNKVAFLLPIILLLACNNNSNQNKSTDTNSSTENQPVQMAFTITNQFPHDTGTYTEGLEFNNHLLFESGGQYDAKTFAKIKEFTYDGEGWGMTNNGKQIIMSDGSNNIYFRDPETFKVLSILGVTDNNGPVGNVNELEYIKGNPSYILANVWQTDYILKIDPESGKVLAKADFGGTKEKYFPEALNKAEVLNGIAYDRIQNRFFITGKNWSKLFEVKFN